MSLCLRDPTRLAAGYCVREMFMGYMELCALIVSHLGVTEDGNVHLLFIIIIIFLFVVICPFDFCNIYEMR